MERTTGRYNSHAQDKKFRIRHCTSRTTTVEVPDRELLKVCIPFPISNWASKVELVESAPNHSRLRNWALSGDDSSMEQMYFTIAATIEVGGPKARTTSLF